MALEIAGMTLGLREGVIALIALVAIYMLFVLLRMRHLRHQPNSEPVLARSEPEPAMPEAPSGASFAGDDKADVYERPSPRLTEQVFQRGLEQEVSQLRDELDSIRGELAALRADMLQELAHLRATQSVSPIYGDAMQMAAAGYEPAMIAERCGIARAEAELVVALAKSQER